MEAEYSKNMVQRLTAYRQYLEQTCKSPLLHKEQIIVEKESLLCLLDDLQAFHQLEYHAGQEQELEEETAAMTKEQLLMNALWQAKQIVKEAEVVRDSTVEEALQHAKTEGERILSEARAYEEKVKKEAEEIVAVTLADRRKELADARQALEDSREGILAEAREKGEQLLQQKRAEAEELKKELDAEIDLYRRNREEELKQALHEAQQLAQEELSDKTREALQIYADTVQQTHEMVTLITGLYDQQIDIIRQDRKEILSIIDKLQRQGLQRRKSYQK